MRVRVLGGAAGAGKILKRGIRLGTLVETTAMWKKAPLSSVFPLSDFHVFQENQTRTHLER
jgi:hypothetical protein